MVKKEKKDKNEEEVSEEVSAKEIKEIYSGFTDEQVKIMVNAKYNPTEHSNPYLMSNEWCSTLKLSKYLGSAISTLDNKIMTLDTFFRYMGILEEDKFSEKAGE